MKATEELVVSKGKIRIDNSDGTVTELDFIMPKQIAEHILCSIIGWEDKWTATTSTHEKYQEAKKAFLDK